MSSEAKSSLPSELSFRVSSRTMQMLGRENISSPVVAVLELVKNAYDADASQVKVIFCQASSEDGSITIEDNGEGMDLDALRNHWMVISTDNKLRSPTTNKGRYKVGEKGIGRLAMDRLARQAALVTYRRNAGGLKLVIDWTKYEQDVGHLHKISHPLFPVPPAGEGKSGTTLYLTGLRDRWTYRDYQSVHSDLSLLVPPFEQSLIDFSIIFDCDEAPDLSGPIVSPMATVAEYILESTLSADGYIHHILMHRSGEVVEDKRTWEEAFSDVSSRVQPKCGPLRFILYFYLREAGSLKETTVRLAELLEFLQRFQGVRIYRDNFRVKPYGDPGSDRDWLGLNARRVRHPGGVGSRKGGWVLAENQVVGSIFIARHDNPALQDQTNREGLVENDAYRDMRRFVLHAIQFLERERQARYHRKKGKTKPEVPVEQALATSERQLTEVAAELRETAQKIAPIFQPVETTSLLELAEKVEVVATQIQESEITYSEERTERQLMIGLATLGIAMTAFGHETARAVNSVLNRAELLGDVVKELPEAVRAEAQRNLQALIESADRIEAWGQFALDRVRRDKRTQQNINVNQAIETVLKAFRGPLEQRHVRLHTDLSPDLPPLRAFAMDIEAIFINFITNATEAMRHTPLEDREIKVNTSYNKVLDEFQFHFCDSGRGIRPEDVDKIFDPLFSTKVDAKGKPVGTGLGLTIVNNVVASYNGRIEVEGHGQLGGAEFWIFLPHRYQRRRKND